MMMLSSTGAWAGRILCQRLRPLATAGALVALGAGLLGPAAGSASAAAAPASPNVLLVGSWHGKQGQYQSIQAAVDAAKPGDWILVGPGDYKESPSSESGVWVSTPDVHIRGMQRNSVIVDGTLPGTPTCDPAPSAQNFGPSGSGRNGIWVFEANGDSVQNLSVCNFLSGTGNTGNEVWFDGGAGTGEQHLGSFSGSYLTTTSTYANDTGTDLAQYGLFVSNTYGPGQITDSFGSNMADAGIYVGACPNCNVVLDHDTSLHNVLGYSGTNSGGNLLIQNSVFADNKSGIVPNSENNDDAPPPQNGACPPGTTGPLGTGSCTVIRDNLVLGNNDPNVPGGQPGGGLSVIGAGIVLAGGQNDTVAHNFVAGNGSWGILANDFPYIGTPPPQSHCQGGTSLLPNLCFFPAFGNTVQDNLLWGNGGFGNPTNGDLAEATIPHDPGNCWIANSRFFSFEQPTSDPADLQATQGTCGAPGGGDLIGPLGLELACATGALGSCAGSGEAAVVAEIIALAQALGQNPAPLEQPGIDTLAANYPLLTHATAPYPSPQPSMPDPCAGVPANPWCHGPSGGVTGVLAGNTMNGQPLPCVTQSDGVRVCHGDESGPGGADLRLRSFDGTPLALYVTLPPAPASGPDRDYPLVVQSHGWGAPPSGPDDTQYGGPTADQWARDGYAVLQLTARGWGDSCGSGASRQVNVAACANGYIRLDDERYEARDVQYAVGLLVDEGIADANRIGVTGDSYGAGVSLELATLNDRVMLPDGRLVPWRSPSGRPLHIAAAAPFAGWSDLAYALLPNGRTLDSQVTSPTADLSPVGVEKESIVSGLYAVGALEGYYAAPGVNPQADLTTWYQNIAAGEPYNTPVDRSVIQQIAQFHFPYYLLDRGYGNGRERPAPLLVANGFTDDVFPVDEALRYYNLERSLYPSDPIALFDFDGGHMRGQNKPADAALLSARIKSFFDHYVKGTGPRPMTGVTALTQTCPASAPSGGPFLAPTWSALHPGEVRYSSRPTQTILSTAGNPTISKTFDPVIGGGACATAPAADQGAGVATYRLPAATGSGYTLLGSATVTADLHVTGKFAYVAARLLDVDPVAGTETLVARGVYRADPNAPNGLQVFQLHPGAWHFAAGHVPKLELLGQDAPYTRPSNGTFSISVSNLQLRLPVHEVPGAPGTPPAVQNPLTLVPPHPMR
jgi:dienelactone hydrolase